MKYAFFFLLLLGGAAAAAPGPHDFLCPYPEAALKAAIGGSNMVSYEVTPDGTVRNVVLTAQSVSSELDEAAVRCVSGWTSSAGPDWKLVAAVHEVRIYWLIAPAHPEATGGHPLFKGTMGRPHLCNSEYPKAEAESGIGGTTTVKFKIKTDGYVANPYVAVSSGNQNLDRAALACVMFWHYLPALQDGAPVEVTWQARSAGCRRPRRSLPPSNKLRPGLRAGPPPERRR